MILTDALPTATPVRAGAEGSLQLVMRVACAEHTILQAFDRLRRGLAQALVGSEGVFAGYSRLEIAAPLEGTEGEVIVTAFASAREVGPHGRIRIAVDYFAERERDRGDGLGAAGRTVVAQASGLTLLPS